MTYPLLRTRNEAQIRKDWPWGEIKAMHNIGDDYLIVEFRPNRPANEPHKSRWKRSDRRFHPFVKGRHEKTGEVYFDDTSHSYYDLDSALVACVVYKYEWANQGKGAAMNERLTSYFMRMLRVGS